MKKYVFLLALSTLTQALLAQGGDNQGVPKEFIGNFERNLPKENLDKAIRGTRYSTEDYCAGDTSTCIQSFSVSSYVNHPRNHAS